MICLDTNAVIVLINNPDTPARARFNLAVRNGDPVAVSVVVLFELWYGVANSRRRQYNAELDCGFSCRTDPALKLRRGRRSRSRRYSCCAGALRQADRALRRFDCCTSPPARRDAGDGEPPRIGPRAGAQDRKLGRLIFIRPGEAGEGDRPKGGGRGAALSIPLRDRYSSPPTPLPSPCCTGRSPFPASAGQDDFSSRTEQSSVARVV